MLYAKLTALKCYMIYIILCDFKRFMNLGYQNFAILDSHILKFMNHPKGDYLEIEKDFRSLAEAHNLTPAQFDAVLWKRAAGVTEEEFVF